MKPETGTVRRLHMYGSDGSHSLLCEPRLSLRMLDLLFEKAADCGEDTATWLRVSRGYDRNCPLTKAILRGDVGVVRSLATRLTVLGTPVSPLAVNAAAATTFPDPAADEEVFRILFGLSWIDSVHNNLPWHVAAATSENKLRAFSRVWPDADINCRDYNGDTVLGVVAAADSAGSSSDEAYFAFLRDAGAESDMENNEGQRPVHLAAGSLHKLRAFLRVWPDTDVDCRDLSGRTPLHFAASADNMGNERRVTFLLKWGASISEDFDGNLPLQTEVFPEFDGVIGAEVAEAYYQECLAAEAGTRPMAVLDRSGEEHEGFRLGNDPENEARLSNS